MFLGTQLLLTEKFCIENTCLRWVANFKESNSQTVLIQCSCFSSSRGHFWSLSWTQLCDGFREAQRPTGSTMWALPLGFLWQSQWHIERSEPNKFKHEMKETWRSVCWMLVVLDPLWIVWCPHPNASGQVLWECITDPALNRTRAHCLKFDFSTNPLWVSSCLLFAVCKTPYP